MREQEVQEVLAVLEAGVVEAELLGIMVEQIRVVLAQQEVMVEAEAAEATAFLADIKALVALVALD